MQPSEARHRPGTVAYAFGPFVVDPVKRRLWREGRPVPITSKTFDVLVVLLEHRDHIVSKDELLNRVWPDTASTRTIWPVRFRLCGERLASVRTSTITSSPFPVRDIGSSPMPGPRGTAAGNCATQTVSTILSALTEPATDIDDPSAPTTDRRHQIIRKSQIRRNRVRCLAQQRTALVARGIGIGVLLLAWRWLRRRSFVEPTPVPGTSTNPAAHHL